MKPIIALAALVTLVTTTPISPTSPDNTTEVEADNNTLDANDAARPTLPGLYVCGKPEWNGVCVYGTPPSLRNHSPDGFLTCHNLAFLDKEMMSFGPDKGINCAVFTEKGCHGDVVQIESPGWAYMPAGAYNGGVGGFKSYTCEWKK
jgi:hypothetical protein